MNTQPPPVLGWSKEWEEQIYSQGTHINRYPFGEVISLVNRHLLKPMGSTPRTSLAALEIGCGTGNNLLFFAQEGLQTFGLDGSATAIQLAHSLLERNGLQADLRVHDFAHGLPFPAESFDLVLDRGALTHNSTAQIRQTLQEVHRALKPGGLFLSITFYSTAHHLFETGQPLDSHTRRDVTGTLESTGVVHFTDQAELEAWLGNFEIQYLVHHHSDILNAPQKQTTAFYSCVARKPF